MNYRFVLKIETRGLGLMGEATVAEASRSKAEAVLRATLADPEGWHTTLEITPHPEDEPEPTDWTIRAAEAIVTRLYSHAVDMHEGIALGRGALDWRDREAVSEVIAILQRHVPDAPSPQETPPANDTVRCAACRKPYVTSSPPGSRSRCPSCGASGWLHYEETPPAGERK